MDELPGGNIPPPPVSPSSPLSAEQASSDESSPANAQNLEPTHPRAKSSFGFPGPVFVGAECLPGRPSSASPLVISFFSLFTQGCLSAARGVWENAIKKSGSVFEVWEQYISMEVEMGHLHEARSLYKRCYSKRFAGSGSEEICHSWIRFEEENGTLDDYDLAVKKVTPRLKELMTFRSQEEAKVEAYPNPNDNSNANDSSQKVKWPIHSSPLLRKEKRIHQKTQCRQMTKDQM